MADRVTAEVVNGTPTATNAYDAASQLTGDGASSRSYDGAGNRTDGSMTVGAGNRISSDGTWTYTHDAAGRRVKKSLGASAKTWTYQYDHRGHLTRLDQRSTDGGTLVSRIEGTDSLLDLDGSNTAVARRVFGDRVDEVVARVEAGGVVPPTVTIPGVSCHPASLNFGNRSRFASNSFTTSIARRKRPA